MRGFRTILASNLLLACTFTGALFAADGVRVTPYLQHPARDAMTIRWVADSPDAGTVTITTPDGPKVFTSESFRAGALAYNPFKAEPGEPHPAVPWMHRVRVTGLQPGTEYSYRVEHKGMAYAGKLRTAPDENQPIRLIVYSDPETEPESTTSPSVDWPASPNANRPAGVTRYLVNQTIGYQQNCRVITERKPDLLLIAGDLVETGGEQRDWDEFWRHNAGDYGAVGATVPIIPSLGNHENYAGPGGGYTAAGADFATEKFRTYFEVPANQASNPDHRGRYYRLDYGPITLLVLDSSDGLPDKTASDTNHNLTGSRAPDFNPESEQYRWMVEQLTQAQKTSRFTFVQFHHTMYGSGPHSIPFGNANFSGQSGIAMRVILPVLFRYGVDAVFSGHDEMLERSQADGTETLPDGTTRPHSIHFYDVGIGGDGLRGPSVGFDNPYRKFLAHEQAPEVWEGNTLVSGGKHYGHLEVNVKPDADGRWQAILTPVYLFPITDEKGEVVKWERREYDDVVTLNATQSLVPKAAAAPPAAQDRSALLGAGLLCGVAGISWLFRARGKDLPRVL